MSNESNARQEAITDAVLAGGLKEQQAKGPNLRQLHSKSHGLVSGKFTIEKDLPDHCKVGVFATHQEYDIWVRFSNGSSPKELGVFKPDTEGDVRGMAIKIKNIEGEKVPSDEVDTQDFTLVNHHVFFLPDVAGYIDFGKFRKARESGEPLDPELAKKLEPTLAMLGEMNSKVVANPLCIQYWSTTPYKLGSNFIKFSVKPHNIETPPTSRPDSPNYLREAMLAQLTTEKKEAAFDFLVQFFVDEDKTPIENPMQEWKQEDSPFIKLATITIPAQEFDNVDRKKLDESLSFTPWHTLPEHEPVGSVNLSRRKIYQEMAKARRESHPA
ncbi:MAG: catalase family protein [Microcystis sp. M046S1]|uniref:catalase family protein n=1 Tax=Microcystis sp. M046S1 TaxID=2771118 RepID=UPI00258BFD2E|nr:catalase family protein [Microcystis sp. M046S1]MCA2880786.1 catalase family protein [Microcystis sp. M046S1]